MHTPRKPALGFIFITLLLDVMGFSLLIPVGPKLVQSLLHGGAGGTDSEAAPMYSLLLSTFQVFAFFFSPILGVLSDRFGRRPVILISLAGSAVDFLGQALAPNLTLFFITRAINGISGANMGACTAYVADISPPEKRAGSIGLLFVAFGVGFTIGPAIGGWLGGYDLRLPFYAASGFTFLNWIYGYFVLPESLPPERRTRTIQWSRTNPLGALVNLTRYPVVLGLAVALFLLNAAQFCLHSTWAFSMQNRFNWTPKEVGFSLLAVGVMSMIVQGGVVRKLVPAIGEKRAMALGVTVTTLAFLGYGLATQPWMIYAVIVAAAIGGIAGPSVQAIITKSVQPNEQGTIQGALASIGSLSGILGPEIGGYTFAYFTGPQAPVHLGGASFLAAAGLSLMGTVVAVGAMRKMPATAPQVTGSVPAAAMQPEAEMAEVGKAETGGRGWGGGEVG